MRRSALRLSQEKLAELIGVTFQQIQKYEKGVNRVSAATLYRIAQELRVHVSELMPRCEPWQPSVLPPDATMHALAKAAASLNPAGQALLVSFARQLSLCERLTDQASR